MANIYKTHTLNLSTQSI